MYLSIFEASKLNPGKKMILGSLLGSKSAAEVVKAATQALKQWPKLDRGQKKSFYEKIADLKAAARQTLSSDLKNANPGKKKIAREKAGLISQKFAAAVKRREASNDVKPDVSKLEQQRDQLKDWLMGAQAEMEKEAEGKSETELEKIGAKWISMAQKKAEEYNKVIKQIEDANKSNEAFNILVESFTALFEFDAEDTVDNIKDKAEELTGNSGDDEDDDYNNAMEKIKEYKAELSDKKKDLVDLKKEIDELNSDIYSLKKSGEDDDMMDSMIMARDEKKEELEELQDEIEEIQSEIDQLSSQYESRVVMTFENFVSNRYTSL